MSEHEIKQKDRDTSPDRLLEEHFERLTGLAGSYAEAAWDVLSKTEHPLNSKIKSAIHSSIFVAPVHDEEHGFGINMYGDLSYEEKRQSIGVAMVDPTIHPEWFNSEFPDNRSDLVAIYRENYRTIFIRTDAVFSDHVKGLVFVHEFLHAVRHKERNYEEVNIEDPRHSEEEVETLEYEIELAKHISPEFQNTFSKLLESTREQVEVSDDKRHVNFGEYNQEIIDSLATNSEAEKKVLGTLLRCGVAFAILEEQFGQNTLGAKVDYVEQNSSIDLRL